MQQFFVHLGCLFWVAQKIDNIRKRSVAVERKLLNEMDKVPVKLSDGSKVGLGTYLDAQNFIEKFHMGGSMGDKHGVFAYKGLFEVVCGVGVINDDINLRKKYYSWAKKNLVVGGYILVNKKIVGKLNKNFETIDLASFDNTNIWKNPHKNRIFTKTLVTRIS